MNLLQFVLLKSFEIARFQKIKGEVGTVCFGKLFRIKNTNARKEK